MANRIPVSKIMDAIGNGRDAAEMVNGTVCIDVRVDRLVSRWVAEAVREDLDQHQSGGIVDVRRLGAHRSSENEATVVVDAAVVLAGGSDQLVAASVRSYVGRGIPVCVVAESSLDLPELDLPEELDRLCTPLATSDRKALDEGLAEWLLQATDKHVSMAANFPFCRKAEAERLERRCAMENAAVGAVDLLHGADLPIMCGNQLKLYFDLAAARGMGLAPQRVAGAAVVVALAFGWRAIGRSLVHHTPAAKFVTRAAMGYAGTVATSQLMGAMLDVEGGTFALPQPDVLSWAKGVLAALGRGARQDGETVEVSPALDGTYEPEDEGPTYYTYEAGGSVR